MNRPERLRVYKERLERISRRVSPRVDAQIRKFETFEELFEASRQDGYIFDMGGGSFAEYEGIWLAKDFMFEPIRNEVYWEERRKLKDHFTIHIEDSERLLELARQYLDWLEKGKPWGEVRERARTSRPPL